MNISQNTTEILKLVVKHQKLFLWGCQPDGTPTLSMCIQHGTGAQQGIHIGKKLQWTFNFHLHKNQVQIYYKSKCRRQNYKGFRR